MFKDSRKHTVLFALHSNDCISTVPAWIRVDSGCGVCLLCAERAYSNSFSMFCFENTKFASFVPAAMHPSLIAKLQKKGKKVFTFT